MSSSKRTASSSQTPKAPTSLSSHCTISDTATLTGTNLITIRGDTVIHPRAKIISTYAPVSVGNCCILSERSNVGLQSASDNQSEGVIVEDYVVVEVGAIVEAKRVGEGSLIEVNARLGKGSVVGKVTQ